MSSLTSNDLINCRKNVIEIISTGELFLHQINSAQRQFEYLMNEKEITKSSLENFNENVNFAIKLKKKYGYKFLHIVFPCKAIIRMNELRNVGIEVNPLYSIVHEQSHTIYPVDSMGKINGSRLYDTHYSGVGQWAIIQRLLGELSLPYATLIPKFEVTQMVGDLTKMLGGTAYESVQRFIKFDKLEHNIKCFTNKNAIASNNGHIVYSINSLAWRKERVLIFGDSFFLQCLNMISQIFEEVIFIRCSYVMEDVIASLSPDIVLSGQAERYLVNTPNCLTSAPYFSRYFNNSFDGKKLDQNFINATNALFSPRGKGLHKHWRNSIVENG